MAARRPAALQDSFQRLQTALRRDPRVTEMEMFGARGFKVSGKVFAIFWKGDLVLKLPEERAQALVAARVAKSWDPGHGRKMKEWVAFPPLTAAQWLTLSQEAREMVAAGGAARRATARTGRRKRK